jgi:hypothetical protein
MTFMWSQYRVEPSLTSTPAAAFLRRQNASYFFGGGRTPGCFICLWRAFLAVFFTAFFAFLAFLAFFAIMPPFFL